MTATPDERAGADQTGGPAAGVFRLGMVPGVNPGRWVRVWEERLRDVPLELVPVAAADAEHAIRSRDVAAGLLRLPVDRDGLDCIPMYTEATVVVVPKDHLFTAAEEITAADLADETLVVPDDDVLGWADAPGDRFAGAVATTGDALDLVAAGHAVLVAPHSVARLHLRRGLTTRPVTDAPGSAVGLAWLTTAYDDLVEELIGIVRGRTAASSRGRGAAPEKQGPRARAASKGAAKGSATKGAGAKGGAKGGGGKGGGAKSGGASSPRRSSKPGGPSRRGRR